MSLDLQPSGSNQLGLRSGGQLVITILHLGAGWLFSSVSHLHRKYPNFRVVFFVGASGEMAVLHTYGSQRLRFSVCVHTACVVAVVCGGTASSGAGRCPGVRGAPGGSPGCTAGAGASEELPLGSGDCGGWGGWGTRRGRLVLAPRTEQL